VRRSVFLHELYCRRLTQLVGDEHLLVKRLYQYDTPTLSTKGPSHNAEPQAGYLPNLAACEGQIAELYANCTNAHPNFGVTIDDFTEGVARGIRKYLLKLGDASAPSVDEIRRFISELQINDLYLSLGCAAGNEHAWWEFDRTYRPYIDRVARHLVGNRVAADEAIDFVYAELFGTTTAGGARQSKFRTYTGRGTLRGWLRAVIWHALVDLYRQREAEIPLDQCAELNEGGDVVSTRTSVQASEELMLEKIVRERYRVATVAALDQSLTQLEPHETLLLMYYHVDGLKLREIARIIESPTSPMRRWFKRSGPAGSKKRSERVHESTVMRWLEKAYRKVAQAFCAELQNKHGLKRAEIELCMAMATEDLGQTVRIKSQASTFNQSRTTRDAKSNR